MKKHLTLLKEHHETALLLGAVLLLLVGLIKAEMELKQEVHI